MKLYNTLTNKLETLDKKKRINMFVCGPTVYGPTHLGHAKTVLTFDIMVKYFRSVGYRVFYLQNITDIDDKIIHKAQEEGKTVKAVAKKFSDEYFRIVKSLDITAVNKYAPATKFIPQIIRQVKTLIKKGYAYRITDGYYFNIAKFKDYGKLAKRTAAQADDGVSRIDENEEKINRGDFCLWKFRKPNEPFWKSSLGEGRPGWHIEDTAITETFFGPQYDIHGGGSDLLFPHHEAELAQQEAASGKKPFVKLWLHVGLVLKDGRKMSKSLGNFETAQDFISKNGSLAFRIITATHHYRSTLDINESALQEARAIIQTFIEIQEKLNFVSRVKRDVATVKSSEIGSEIKKAEQTWRSSLENDFNTGVAFTTLFELIKYTEKNIWKVSKRDALRIKKTIQRLLGSLGIKISPKVPPQSMEKLARKRELLRSKKLFQEADLIRGEMKKKGYTVDDTPLGPLVRTE